jgi:hypothetical protein
VPRCFSIDVASPCQVGWETMQGDDNIRQCSLCNKNVFNLSNMTEQEVADIFEINRTKICVSIRKRSDGTLYTDNCPRRLRTFRNFMRIFLPGVLPVVAGLFHQSPADAQWVGTSPLETMGQSNEVGQLADYGYDTARDFVRIATIASFILMSSLFAWRVQHARKLGFERVLEGTCLRNVTPLIRRQIVKWGALVIFIPVIVHIVGVWTINNNMNGLGGGL